MSIYCCCIICKKVFSYKGIFVHYDRSHGTEEQKTKYSNGYNGHYNDLEYKRKISISNPNKREISIRDCLYCGKSFQKEQKFCSRSCSALYKNARIWTPERREAFREKSQIVWTPERRKKQSDKIKELWKTEEYRDKMLPIITNSRRFTSRNEIIIREHFIATFPLDHWTFGGCINMNENIISRDLYSPLLKICIEYDGIWHFKDIHNQLESKQQKDIALEQWCLLNGYRLIRIDEDIYNRNPQLYLDYLVYLAYYSLKPIIKIGLRY